MTTAFVERFRRAQKNGGAAAPDWLSPLRRAAMDRFTELGVPSQKNEDWHFTSLQQLANSEFGVAKAAAPAPSMPELQRLELGRISWPTIVFVNGRFSPALSSLDSLPAGMVVLPLAGVMATRSELAEKYLGKVATFDDQSFTALNTAFMRDGAFIHVPRGAQSALPIRVLHVADENAADCAVHPRTLVVAEANSNVHVVESFVSTTSARYFTNAVTEIVLKDGARVNHYKTQNESLAAFHVGTLECRQERNSHFVSFSIATGSRLSRTNIYTLLDGEGCGATLNGLYMVDGEQHVDHQTRIIHAQPNCFSREVYKGILDGSSHGVFNGKVFVHPIAQKTDGKQSNNNLLLSEKAHVDTKPQLEIFADDVKCTHGATVGRLDQVALFYMKSRGLNTSTARDLLTYAFAAEVLEEIELEEMKVELESITMSRFTHI